MCIISCYTKLVRFPPETYQFFFIYGRGAPKGALLLFFLDKIPLG